MLTSTVNISVPVSDGVLEEFQRQAIIYGFARVKPGKPWTSDEKRECVRFVMRVWFVNFCKERGVEYE